MGDRRLQQVVHGQHVVRQDVGRKIGVIWSAGQVHDNIHPFTRAVDALARELKGVGAGVCMCSGGVARRWGVTWASVMSPTRASATPGVSTRSIALRRQGSAPPASCCSSCRTTALRQGSGFARKRA